MSTDRSDALYGKWRESTEKFDYFMLGVLGALCAYLSQGYKPERIGVNPGSVELLALLTLVLAAVLGFRRIEAMNQGTILNHRILHTNELRGFLTSVMQKGPGFNEHTGETYTPEYAARQIPILSNQIQQLKIQHEEVQSKAENSYAWRNALTLIGFLMLLSAKIYSAYTLG